MGFRMRLSACDRTSRRWEFISLSLKGDPRPGPFRHDLLLPLSQLMVRDVAQDPGSSCSPGHGGEGGQEMASCKLRHITWCSSDLGSTEPGGNQSPVLKSGPRCLEAVNVNDQ